MTIQEAMKLHKGVLPDTLTFAQFSSEFGPMATRLGELARGMSAYGRREKIKDGLRKHETAQYTKMYQESEELKGKYKLWCERNRLQAATDVSNIDVSGTYREYVTIRFRAHCEPHMNSIKFRVKQNKPPRLLTDSSVQAGMMFMTNPSSGFVTVHAKSPSGTIVKLRNGTEKILNKGVSGWIVQEAEKADVQAVFEAYARTAKYYGFDAMSH